VRQIKMLGFSKLFIIVLALAAIIGFGTHNFNSFLAIMIIYIIGRIIFNILS
jgi:hypothetical protein